MKNGWILLTLACAAAGCEAPTGPSERAQLAQARARWSEQGGLSYSFEVTRGCFCILAGRRVRVTVEQGVVTKAEYLDSGNTVELGLLAYIPTVPDLFDLVDDALDGTVASLAVSYDPIYGYPARIEVDYSATAADDEMTLTARDLTLVQALGRMP